MAARLDAELWRPRLPVSQLAAAFLALLLAGCATLSPAQRDILEKAQALADRIAAKYRVRPVRLEAARDTLSDVGADGIVRLHPVLLSVPGALKFAVAHEMAHWIAGDPGRLARLHWEPPDPLWTALEIRRVMERKADILAIELLVGVGEMPEAQALQAAAWFMGKMLQAEGAYIYEHGPWPPGPHPSACERLENLHRRFPRVPTCSESDLPILIQILATSPS